MNPREILQTVETVLAIDWPSRDVPDTLVRAGFHVVVRGGPGPEDYSVYELKDGDVIARKLGRPPDRADLVYSYRPLSELPGIIAVAKQIQAKTVWTQSGLSEAGVKDRKGCWLPEEERRAAQSLVEAAELNYVSEPYIGDVARALRTPA